MFKNKESQPPFQRFRVLSVNLDPVPVSSGRSLVESASTRILL